tara:strand:+ start:3573 stop:3755 length:183 start_codon:yes stop_codon:yes gene_type:complete
MVDLNIRKGNNMARGKGCANIKDPAARAACMKRAKKNKIIDKGTPNVPGAMKRSNRGRQY